MTDFTVKFNYVMEVHENLVRDKHCIAGIRDENLLISAINRVHGFFMIKIVS